MEQDKLVSKLIDLEDKATAHTSEYLKLVQKPGKKTQASLHYRKALKLRSRIQEVIRKIALAGGSSNGTVFAERKF